MALPAWQRLLMTSGSVAVAFIVWLLRRKAKKQIKDEAKPRPALVTKKSSRLDVALPSPEQTMGLIMARRSIFPKDYNGKGKSASDEDIKLMLEAANWAPTHKRTEPWRFVVFKGKAMQQVLDATVAGNKAASVEERGETFEAWLADWQVSLEKKWNRCEALISLSMLRQAKADQPPLPEWEEIGATACAVQNMHLMATSLGLSGYWSSWNIRGRDSEAMAKVLGISREAGDRCLGFFVLGSSDAKVRSGRGPLDEKTRWAEA